MTIEEMKHRIGGLQCEPTMQTILELANIVDSLIDEVGRLEARVGRSERSASAAANVASDALEEIWRRLPRWRVGKVEPGPKGRDSDMESLASQIEFALRAAGRLP